MNAIVHPASVQPAAPLVSLPRFDAASWGFDEADVRAFAFVLPQIGFNPEDVGMRFDDAGIFFSRALDYVKATVYAVRRPQMNGDALVPTVQDTPAWAESITWSMYDEVGMAKIIANYSDDLPRADVRGREMSVRVQTIGDSYGYNTHELRAAAQGRSNLPTRRAVAARNFIDRKLTSLKLRGDTAYNMFGLSNHPNIPLVAPVTGAHATTATGDQIVADVSALLNSIVVQSNGVHSANVLGVDPIRLQHWRTKRITGGNQETALQVIQTQFPGVNFVEVPELKGAGTAGANILFAGERDAENYWYDLPMGLVQHPPQARNLEFVVPCESRTGGFILARPLSVAIMSGV